MRGLFCTVPGTCGLAAIYGYNQGYGEPLNGIAESVSKRGTGLAVAGFIETETCRKVYEYFTSTYEVLYQSPVRYNRNSGNSFFFIIIDTRSKK